MLTWHALVWGRQEYKLVLHEAVSTPKGDKRGASFGRAKLNLAKYAAAHVGKRVALTLTKEGVAAADAARPLSAIVTVAVESADKDPDESPEALLDEAAAAAAAADKAFRGARRARSARAQRAQREAQWAVARARARAAAPGALTRAVRAAGAGADEEHEEDDAPAAHGAHGARRHKRPPAAVELARHEGGSSDDDCDDEPPSPAARVAPAAGAKPLPPPPPPTQLRAKAVEWRGMGAGTVAASQRLFAACCPCLQPKDTFQPFDG